MYDNELRRYSDLATVLDAVMNEHLVALNPKRWEDKNDAFYIARYASESHFEDVLALCFTAESETFHHWKVYGLAGACMVFHRDEFLEHIATMPSLLSREVNYFKNDEIERDIHKLDIADLPFVKRHQFRHEKEHRIVYGSVAFAAQTQEVPVPLKFIKRIVINPWMAPEIYLSVKRTINSIAGCEKVTVNRSVLLDADRFQTAFYNRANWLPPE